MCRRRLYAEMRIVAVQLGQQVLDTCDVHPRLFQLDQRVPLALFVLGNAGDLFEEALALLRLHREDAAHLALPDERVVTEPEPCRCQQLFDIPELNIVSVDEEVRFPGTEDAPSHSDLVRASAEHVALVVEHDLGFGIVDGMACRAAGEDKVQHRTGTKRPQILLTPVSYTHLRAHETRHDLVCRLLLAKTKTKRTQQTI